MYLSWELQAVPPPEGRLGIPQLTLIEHAIQVGGRNRRPVLLSRLVKQRDCRPCSPQPGNLHHFIIGHTELGYPGFHLGTIMKEKPKFLEVGYLLFDKPFHDYVVKAEIDP